MRHRKKLQELSFLALAVVVMTYVFYNVSLFFNLSGPAEQNGHSTVSRVTQFLSTDNASASV